MAQTKEVFARNLKHYMDLHDKNQKEIAKIVGVSPPTVHDWLKAKICPRMNKIDILAQYFNVTKSDLIEEHNEATTVSPIEIGNLVRKQREAMGLTHEQLAQRTGISAKKLKQWETGKSTRPLGEAKILSAALDIPFGKLMGVQMDTEQIQRQRFRERLYKEIPHLVLSDEEIAQVINYIKFVISQRK